MIDDYPSQEDVERFADETAFCPHCGAEIWDDANECSACGNWLMEGTSSKDPIASELTKKVSIIIVIIVLLGFLSSIWFLF